MRSRTHHVALLGPLLTLFALVCCVASGQADEGFRVVVQADQPGPRFSPIMHGVFFEDINYAADGGLYAELVQNRSFEHTAPQYAWSTTGEGAELEIAKEDGLHKNNPAYAKLTLQGAGGLVNAGYDGFAIEKGAEFYASVHARSVAPGAKVTAVLRGQEGEEVGRVLLGETGADWAYFEKKLTASGSAPAATLEVVLDQPGEHHLDMVSLFPVDTFKGRRNGLRKDLAEKLAGLHAKFVRFPGGCVVEGDCLANAYRWKDTVGPIWQRKQNYNLWRGVGAPHYHQTYGLGFFEYFQLCEDLGAEAAPIVNCGMACQFRSEEMIPVGELDEWVQDALDLVEFANGPVTSKWGKLRAEMGHPEPFNLKCVGVGNEQWREVYFDRYMVFYNALRSRYPDLKIVSTSGPGANDSHYRYAWRRFAEGTPADVVDEHYYRPPQWFLTNSERYDRYDRSGPEVFAGEFAAHESDRKSTLRAAISEAAFMTGLWRNADVVTMASYAPLFARHGAIQWQPDLIWFDNTTSYGTPSYHVQAMYGANVPDVGLPVEVDASALPKPVLRGRVGIGTWSTQAEFKDFRVVRGDQTLYASDGTLDGWETHGGDWSSEGGVIRQTSDDTNVRAFVGEADWTDYSIRLKARKTGGREGFLVSFASGDPAATSWWNLGGWGNTRHGLEAPGISLTQTRGTIEEGRWYDVRINVSGDRVTCYLDGQEVQSATLAATPAVYAASGLDEETGEYVVAVANPGDTTLEGTVAIAGASLDRGASGKAIVLTGSPLDINSLEDPTRVEPSERSIVVDGDGVTCEFPSCSFTVLRLPAAR